MQKSLQTISGRNHRPLFDPGGRSGARHPRCPCAVRGGSSLGDDRQGDRTAEEFGLPLPRRRSSGAGHVVRDAHDIFRLGAGRSYMRPRDVARLCAVAGSAHAGTLPAVRGDHQPRDARRPPDRLSRGRREPQGDAVRRERGSSDPIHSSALGKIDFRPRSATRRCAASSPSRACRRLTPAAPSPSPDAFLR